MNAVMEVTLLLLKNLMLYFTRTKATSDFIIDIIEDFWLSNKESFSNIKTLIVNSDNGPENSSHRTQFIKRIVEIKLYIHFLKYKPKYIFYYIITIMVFHSIFNFDLLFILNLLTYIFSPNVAKIKAASVYLNQYQFIPYDKQEEFFEDIFNFHISKSTLASMNINNLNHDNELHLHHSSVFLLYYSLQILMYGSRIHLLKLNEAIF